MTDSGQGKRGYEEYYLRLNPPTAGNYQKKARGYARRFARLLDAAEISSCLDLGCGTGMLTNYLCRRGCDDVVGVDCNERLVEMAAGNVRAEFVVDDAAHYLGACERKFDVIFLLDLLEHIHHDDVVELLMKVQAALNEGGFAIVRTPNMNCLQAAGMFYCDWTHRTPFTEGTLYDVARLAGFSRVVFCNQFRMQNFKGKVRACINAVVVPALVWLRGGRKVKVYYRNLVAQLFK